jgi:hypothetical protein
VYLCVYVFLSLSLALRTQLYLRIDRVDLAQASLAALKRLADEDSVIYMLANSWVNIAAVRVLHAVATYVHLRRIFLCYFYY